jgi:rhodanese-related sulfurtransferase
MKNFTNPLAIIMLTFSCASPCLADLNVVQDTNKAVEYFKNELEFKINPFGVKLALDGIDKNVTIVDVRAAKDFKAGHVPSAINIPWDENNNFEGSETEFSGLRKDGYNYVYCYSSACPVAARAAVKFASLGYPVKEIEGGIDAWKTSGLPMKKEK